MNGASPPSSNLLLLSNSAYNQARSETRRQIVFPVPVGESRAAYFLLSLKVSTTFSIYSVWMGYGSMKGNKTLIPFIMRGLCSVSSTERKGKECLILSLIPYISFFSCSVKSYLNSFSSRPLKKGTSSLLVQLEV